MTQNKPEICLTHVQVLTLPVLFLAGDFGDLSSFSAGPQRHMGNSTAVVKHSYTFCKTLAGSLIPPAKCQERSPPLIIAKMSAHRDSALSG